MSQRLTVRLTATLLIVGMFLLAVCLGTAWYVQELQRNISAILASYVSSMRAAEELEISLREVRSVLDGYLLSGDPRQLDALPARRKETIHWLQMAEKWATTPYEQELMQRVRRGQEHFFRELDQITRQPLEEGSARWEMRQLIDQVLTEEILQPAHLYLEFNETTLEEAAENNQQAARRTILGLLLLGVCGPVGGLLAGLGLAQRLQRSLIRLSLPIRDVTGLLNEVIEPIRLKPGWGLEELEVVLIDMARRVEELLERMRRTQQEALRAEQLAALGQLAAGVAHELRNPLMAMKILVQATVARGGSGLGRRDLAVLDEEISRLESLTSTLLDYARPPQVEKQPFELNGLIEDTLSLLSGRAGRRDVRIECDLPAMPCWLEADSGQIRQVVLNLLLNALDAVADGGSVRIEVQTETSEMEQSLAFEVRDDGPGLPDGLGQSIFDPFVSTKTTGLGLGLSICKRIVEAHGGTLTARNAVAGGGAVFRVCVPGRCAAPRRPMLAA